MVLYDQCPIPFFRKETDHQTVCASVTKERDDLIAFLNPNERFCSMMINNDECRRSEHCTLQTRSTQMSRDSNGLVAIGSSTRCVANSDLPEETRMEEIMQPTFDHMCASLTNCQSNRFCQQDDDGKCEAKH